MKTPTGGVDDGIPPPGAPATKWSVGEASEIASATLSGWPQPIDSDVMDLKKERE